MEIGKWTGVRIILLALRMKRCALFGPGVPLFPMPPDVTVIDALCCFPPFPTVPAHNSIHLATMFFIGHTLTTVRCFVFFFVLVRYNVCSPRTSSLSHRRHHSYGCTYFSCWLLPWAVRVGTCAVGCIPCHTTTYCLHVS